MKSLLYSIPPEVCERIANGKQTILLTKRLPKIDTPYKCYLHCSGGVGKEIIKDFAYRWNGTRLIKRPVSKGWLKDSPEQTWQILLDYGFTHPINKGTYVLNGKVFCEFICRGIMHPNDSIKLMAKQSCLSENELDKYARGKTPYGLRITELEIYDKPKELSEFKRKCKQYDKEETLPCHGCMYWHEFGGCLSDGMLPITFPPATYRYVEELQ